MYGKSQVFLAMAASSLSLAAFVVLHKLPGGAQPIDLGGALLLGLAWALSPWAAGLVVAGVNAGIAMARRRHAQMMRDFIWATGIMLIMLVVATVANP